MSIKNGLVALALGASLVGIGCEKKVEQASTKKEVYIPPKECSTIGGYIVSCKSDSELERQRQIELELKLFLYSNWFRNSFM